MNQLSPEALARFLSEDFRRAHPELTEAMAQDLAVRLETALRVAIRDEREACAAECERRRALWAATEEKAETPAQLRAEARARANEAALLADALRARE
ncbi:MAG TPA: hypothetical protein VD838_20040 [Anaeromyxobacteraceae bacterium]|nr:hypothetical protein [Anaeromyxobacteraceae bacterium]